MKMFCSHDKDGDYQSQMSLGSFVTRPWQIPNDGSQPPLHFSFNLDTHDGHMRIDEDKKYNSHATCLKPHAGHLRINDPNEYKKYISPGSGLKPYNPESSIYFSAPNIMLTFPGTRSAYGTVFVHGRWRRGVNVECGRMVRNGCLRVSTRKEEA